MISKFAVFNILPHFNLLMLAMPSTWGSQNWVQLIFVSLTRKLLTKNGEKFLILLVNFFSSASGVIAWMTEQNQQRLIALINRFEEWSPMTMWFSLSRSSINFWRTQHLCRGFPIFSVPKRKIQRDFTKYITLERTTQAYITNIIVDEVALSLFFNITYWLVKFRRFSSFFTFHSTNFFMQRLQTSDDVLILSCH